MMKNVIKMGVVGLGRGRDVMREAIADDNVVLRAVCDRNPGKLSAAKATFERLGVRDLQCFEDYDQMLQADIDAVFVATDAICHVPFVLKALEAGKHVLSEIPAVNSLEEARQLKAAVLAHPELKYMAAENCFYWAFIQSWKQMYEEGKLGQAVYAEAEYLHSQDFREIKAEDHPKEHWRSFNPAIKYLTHDLGPLLYILDDKCVSVSCMEPDIRYNPYRATPNNGVALFKTAKGAVIRILVCFDAYVHADHNYAIIGTRGNIATDKTVSVDTAHSFASFSDIPGTLEQKIEIPVTTRFAGEPAGGHGGADGKMVRDFVRCILDDTKPPIDVDMAIRISLPGIIAHESAVQGGTALEIPEI